MDASTRAALVRAARLEIKQRTGNEYRDVNDDAWLMREGARAERWTNRQTARAGRAFDKWNRERAARETARLRGVNQREAARIRTEGYDISPEFTRRSQARARQGALVNYRNAAGTGVNRWRGSVRAVGQETRFNETEAQRTTRIQSQRRADPLTQNPADFNPPPRQRRNPPGTLTTGRRRN